MPGQVARLSIVLEYESALALRYRVKISRLPDLSEKTKRYDKSWEERMKEESTMRVLLVLTLKIADILGGALFGPCKAEEHVLTIREHAWQLKEFGTAF
jgi:hypothetical protein